MKLISIWQNKRTRQKQNGMFHIRIQELKTTGKAGCITALNAAVSAARQVAQYKTKCSMCVLKQANQANRMKFKHECNITLSRAINPM